MAGYLRELRGYLDTAAQVEGNIARLVGGGMADRTDFATRFETAVAHAGGDAAA